MVIQPNNSLKTIQETESDVKDLEGHDPLKPFWLVALTGNLDGSVDFQTELPDTFHTEDEAIQNLKERGHEGYVYQCIPVAAQNMRFRRLKGAPQ